MHYLVQHHIELYPCTIDNACIRHGRLIQAGVLKAKKEVLTLEMKNLVYYRTTKEEIQDRDKWRGVGKLIGNQEWNWYIGLALKGAVGGDAC